MKLQYITGCICDSLSVNDKEFNELSLEEQKEICHKLIENSEPYNNTLQEIFIKYMECECEGKTWGPCDCCGDIIFEYNKEI